MYKKSKGSEEVILKQIRENLFKLSQSDLFKSTFILSKKNKREFVPKFFYLLKAGITKKQLTNDIMAGIIVGIVADSLAIAFTLASEVSPRRRCFLTQS